MPLGPWGWCGSGLTPHGASGRRGDPASWSEGQELALHSWHSLLGRIPPTAVQVLLGDEGGEGHPVLPVHSAQPLGGHTPSFCRWAAGPLSAHLGQLYPLGNRPECAGLACGPLGPGSALGRTWSSCCWVWALPVPAAPGRGEVTTSTWAAQSTGPSPGCDHQSLAHQALYGQLAMAGSWSLSNQSDRNALCLEMYHFPLFWKAHQLESQLSGLRCLFLALAVCCDVSVA